MDWLTSESKQGSQAWLEFRGKGIGSSDIAAILGVSAFSNVYDKWLEKTDQIPEEKKFKGNWATERGSRLEPIAREMYEKKVGAKFPDAIMVHPQYDFMRVSFDGKNDELKKVIEIKCPGRVAHQKALLGEIPESYWPQVQWQLMISGYDDLDYVSWDGESEELAIVPVKANKKFHEHMIERAIWFWDLVKTRTPPPTAELQVDDQVLTQLLIEREALKAQIDALSISFEMMNDRIKSMVTQDTSCGGYKLKWTEVKGAVDYAKIPALKNIDLEQYRKPASKRFNVTKDKS